MCIRIFPAIPERIAVACGIFLIAEGVVGVRGRNAVAADACQLSQIVIGEGLARLRIVSFFDRKAGLEVADVVSVALGKATGGFLNRV